MVHCGEDSHGEVTLRVSLVQLVLYVYCCLPQPICLVLTNVLSWEPDSLGKQAPKASFP